MPEACKRERDRGVHVRAGDVSGGVDHDGDDEAPGHGLAQLRYALVVLAVDGRRSARHEHQQERRYHLRYHLPYIYTRFMRMRTRISSQSPSSFLLAPLVPPLLTSLVIKTQSYLLEEVGREDVGEGLLRAVHGGDGAALHGGEVVDIVRVVHTRARPRRRGGCRHRLLLIPLWSRRLARRWKDKRTRLRQLPPQGLKEHR
jgi:hypothetical protein